MAFTRGAREGVTVSPRRGKARSHITAALCLVIACLMTSYTAHAGDLDKAFIFNIKAETLDKALLEFGAQAHVQIMFAWDAVSKQTWTRQLKGRFTIREALTELLEGTRLRYIDHGQTLEIIPTTAKGNDETGRVIHDQDPPPGGDAKDKYGRRENLRGPQTSHPQSRGEVLSEVTITGSRLLTTSTEESQEVQIYDRQEIDNSGQNSVSDFLTTLPSVSLASTATAFGVGTTVALRGLPVGTTLVLLNGRRLESSGVAYNASGSDYFDLNNIPLAAVQRIEVDENGSSAIYGSDAIAGVVNIITKKTINGFEANAKYQWAKNLGVVRTNLAWGRQWSGGGLSVIGNYGIDGGLLNSERALSASNDYTRLGGPDSNYPVCSPGNVFSISGAPLPGAPPGSMATFAAVTGPTASGKPALSQFTYGALNECSIVSGLSLLPSTHRAGVLVQGHLKIASGMQLFTELMYTHVTQVESEGYQSLFGVPEFQEYTASAANPYNPFGTTVGVAESLHNVSSPQNFDTDFFRPLIGLRGALAQGWRWEITAWQSIDWSQDVQGNLLPNSAAIQDALNSSNPATALNPFVSGPIASQAVLRSLFTDGDTKWMSRDRSVQAFARGSVLRLPAGNVEAVVGGDYVQSRFNINAINDGIDPPNTRFNYRRTYHATFGEVRVPLVARGGLLDSQSMLSLTGAGRHDQYSDFGGASTYQFGIEFNPADGVLIRATYADAFKAPPLPSLNSPETETPTVVTDPVTGGAALVQLLAGGNPRLRPMTGRSHTIGVVYAGGAALGLHGSVTQWQVVEDNAIQVVPPQVIVDNEAVFPSRVIRNSAGTIVEVIDTNVNFGSINVAGMDYHLDYRRAIGPGVLSTGLDATQIFHYRQALIPGEASVEAAGAAQDDANWAPRWKGTIATDWTEGSVATHMDGRYIGSYQDYDSTRRIGNFWIFDVAVRWNIGEWLGIGDRRIGGSYIESGATNLFNRGPQFSNYFSDLFGYDAAQTSIVGRSLYVETGVRW